MPVAARFRNAAVSVELALSPIEREIIVGRSRTDVPPIADGQPVCVLLGYALDSVGALCRVDPVYAANPDLAWHWTEAATNWLPEDEDADAWRAVILVTATYLDRWQPDVPTIMALAARAFHDGYSRLATDAGKRLRAAYDSQVADAA